jgi:hypothetical protein
MDRLFLSAPIQCIPSNNTAAFRFLSLLADGEPHAKEEVLMVLGDDPRSARQALTSETYGFWLIHNIGEKKAAYQLDARHLSGDMEKDRDARTIALKQLKDRSKKQCERERKRYPRAVKEHTEALVIYQQRFDFGRLDESARVN